MHQRAAIVVTPVEQVQRQMALLWGRPVVVETTSATEMRWFVGRPDGSSEELEDEP